MQKVSVVIPTYNRAKFIEDAIDSVIRQTYNDIEIIVVDDGSTDATPDILKKYGDRIEVIRQKRMGVSSARNRGIKESRGEYIAFLDSDDIFYKRKLEIQMEVVTSNHAVFICYTNEKWILNGEHKNQHAKHRKYSGWIFDRTLPLCIVSPSSAVIKRSVFDERGGFDEKFAVCEDYEFWIRLSLHYPFHYIDMPLVIKRGGHPDQLSRKFWGMDRFRIRALEKILDSEKLTIDQEKLIIEHIVEKAGIIANGASKRDKKDVYDYYKNLKEQYSEHEIFDNSLRCNRF